MKKIIFFIIIGTLAFISCNSPNSSDNVQKPKEYSIIFNEVEKILGEQYALGVINPDGTGLQKFGPGLSSIYSFSVSDNGEKAVYLNRDINNPYITVSNLKNMTDTQFSDIERPGNSIISPNGEYIVYRVTDPSGLFVMNIDGSDRKNLTPSYTPIYYKWSSDSKGIIFASEQSTPSIPTMAYYIDKDGNNDPVEVENPFLQYGIQDLDYYDLTQFTRADLPSLPDSVGFTPSQFNKPKNKAWNALTMMLPVRPPIIMRYLLGYDFNKKTETLINDNPGVLSSSTVSWAPNDIDISVFTQNGLEIVRVDGTRNKILNYTLSQSDQATVYHKWIPRLK
jgi:hypothetical protein